MADPTTIVSTGNIISGEDLSPHTLTFYADGTREALVFDLRDGTLRIGEGLSADDDLDSTGTDEFAHGRAPGMEFLLESSQLFSEVCFHSRPD